MQSSERAGFWPSWFHTGGNGADRHRPSSGCEDDRLGNYGSPRERHHLSQMSTVSGFSIYISCHIAMSAAAKVAQAVPFRKRPSETHSGPGLMTPTDAVAVVRLQHQVRSRPDRYAGQR